MSLNEIIKHGLMWVSSVLYKNHGSKILYYHDVYKTKNYKALDADIYMGTPLELFKQHIDIVKKEGYQIVPKITEPKGQIAIMFDDGFRGIWECRQFFYDNGIKPTVFLPSAFIGRTDLGMLSEEEILELQNHGFIFESHAWSHVQLTDFSDSELEHELKDSRKHLSKFLSKDVTGLCMPLGFFTPHIIDKIKDAGYKDIYSCIPGNYSDMPMGMITRNLCQYSSPSEVRLILRGGNSLLKNRYLKLHNKAEQ